MAKIAPSETTTTRLTEDDKQFYITDGVSIIKRAGFEITEDCPTDHTWIIHNAVHKGYIKIFANVKDEELTWAKLKD